jgi:hypothetical protein
MGNSIKKFEEMNQREVTFTIDEDDFQYITALEDKYPQISKEFKNIMESQYELFAQKMLSYGMENISMGSNLETKDEVKFSLTSIWIRMSDKMNRLRNLVLLGNKNPLDNEPTIDAWIDLTNYAIIAQIVTKGKWKK